MFREFSKQNTQASVSRDLARVRIITKAVISTVHPHAVSAKSKNTLRVALQSLPGCAPSPEPSAMWAFL